MNAMAKKTIEISAIIALITLLALFIVNVVKGAPDYSTGKFYLKVLNDNTIVPNPWWIAIYGKNIKLDNYSLDVGDSIKTYDKDGIYCGVGVIEFWAPTQERVLKYTPIYGDDPFSRDFDEGANIGDIIRFKITLSKPKTTVSVISNPIVVWGRSTDWYGEPSFIRIFSFKSVCGALCGDVNGSGFVDLSDLSTIISYVTVGRAYPFCFENADTNNDGAVDITDLVKVYSLVGGK